MRTLADVDTNGDHVASSLPTNDVGAIGPILGQHETSALSLVISGLRNVRIHNQLIGSRSCSRGSSLRLRGPAPQLSIRRPDCLRKHSTRNNPVERQLKHTRVSMRQITEVLRLNAQGLSYRQIAQSVASASRG